MSHIILANKDQKIKLGLMTQEAQQVLPKVVQTKEEQNRNQVESNESSKTALELLGITEIIHTLIKTAQRLQAQLEESRQQIEALKAEVEQLSKYFFQSIIPCGILLLFLVEHPNYASSYTTFNF